MIDNGDDIKIIKGRMEKGFLNATEVYNKTTKKTIKVILASKFAFFLAAGGFIIFVLYVLASFIDLTLGDVQIRELTILPAIGLGLLFISSIKLLYDKYF